MDKTLGFLAPVMDLNFDFCSECFIAGQMGNRVCN
jgi:hypothetical protein